MTVEDVRDMLGEIEAMAGDDEAAHMEQDRLYVRVLEHIANGDSQHRLIAHEALKVREIKFSRWYA